jgi:hypothetical protein
MNVSGKVNLDARGRVAVETVKGDVQVRNEYSPTEIRDIDGAVTASTTESSIVVEKVSKPVVIDARGSQVTVQNVAAALKVTASHRRVKITDAESTVTLDTRYSSGIELSNIKGNVEITSNSDRVNADDLRGAFKARGTGSSFRINTVAGPVEIATTHKEVIVNDFSASCKVTNEYADVTLASGSLPKGDIEVHNRNGEIGLFLPEESAFQIEARTRDGRIVSNFPGLEPAEAGGERGRLQGRVRTGGPKIVLETEYSNIHVRTQESGPSRRTSKPREPRPPRMPKDLREYSRRSSN